MTRLCRLMLPLLVLLGCQKSGLGGVCHSFRACTKGECTMIALEARKQRVCTKVCALDGDCGDSSLVCYRIEAGAVTGACLKRPTGLPTGRHCQANGVCDHGICAGPPGRSARTCTQLCQKDLHCPTGFTCMGGKDGRAKLCFRRI